MRCAVLLLFALLPLQWFVVPLPLLGGTPVHHAAVLAVTVWVFVRFRGGAFRVVHTFSAPFILSNAALVTVWTAVAFYHGDAFRDAAEQALLLATFVGLAALVHRGLTRSQERMLDALRWSALVCTGSFLLALGLSTVVNGVNPLAVIQQSVAAGDPSALTRNLFRPAFEGFGLATEQARAQLRHEIFGAVLLSACVAAAATSLRPLASIGARWVYRASVGMALLLVATSLSRAVILAACAWPMLALWRMFRTGTVTTRQAALTIGVGVTGLGLAATGLLSVIWVRFTEDTTSYEARQVLLEEALSLLAAHPLGGFDTTGVSAHNLVLDTWLRAGLVAAAAALVAVGWLILLWFRTAAEVPHQSPWLVPIATALALPIVRAFTVGGGALPPVQWVTLGMVVGVLAWHRQRRRSGAAAPTKIDIP